MTQTPTSSWNFAIGAIAVLFVIYITMKGQLSQFIQLFIFQPATPNAPGTPVNPNASSSPLNTVTGNPTPFSVSSANPGNAAAASATGSVAGAGIGGFFGSFFGIPGTIAGAGAGAAAGAAVGTEAANAAANVPNMLNPMNIPAYGWDALTSSGLVNPNAPQVATPQGQGSGGQSATSLTPAWPGLGELPF